MLLNLLLRISLSEQSLLGLNHRFRHLLCFLECIQQVVVLLEELLIPLLVYRPYQLRLVHEGYAFIEACFANTFEVNRLSVAEQGHQHNQAFHL